VDPESPLGHLHRQTIRVSLNNFALELLNILFGIVYILKVIKKEIMCCSKYHSFGAFVSGSWDILQFTLL
jgi:hypothetical protein